jgi:hypothetical protein
MNAFHSRQINHHATVAQADACDIMASTTDGDWDIIGASESDAGNDIGHPGTADNSARPPVDHCIMDLAGIFISGVVGQEQVASKRCAKPVQGGLRDHSNLQVS